MNRSNPNRPWPAPNSRPLMVQSWLDLLFMHWPVDASAIRPLIPRGLELETFDGSAWVGVVPFRMTGIAIRPLPPLPGLSAFPELNVRTYVWAEDKPGVWFFSLDAANLPSVWGGRFGFHLPYFHAKMTCESQNDAVRYTSRRIHRKAPPAEFKALYRPIGDPFIAKPGSLDYFLTERYCLYSADGHGRVYRAEIDHPPWPLQNAEAHTESNTMSRASGIELPNTAPLLHFAREQHVNIWGIQRLSL